MSTETVTVAEQLADGLDYGTDTTVDLPDGRRLVASMGDDWCDIDDWADCYGRVAPCGYRLSDRGIYRPDRPHDFDGAARILRTHNGDAWWWQPTDDAKRDDKVRRDIQRALTDLLTYGTSYLSVRVQSRCERGHWHDDDSVGVGGVEPFLSEADVADLLTDLIYQTAVTA